MRVSLRSTACAALLFGSFASARARPFRFDELARVQRIGGFTLSPDGQWIAYAISTPDVAANRSPSAIWATISGSFG